MSGPNVNNIVVGTVTYGDRYHLLCRSILSVIQAGIKNIVIVDNGCNYSVKDRISFDFSMYKCNFNIIKLLVNNGSAEGFCTAINTSSDIAICEYIYILDDDNTITAKTINNILIQYKHHDYMTCFLSLRRDRKEFVMAQKYGYWNNAELNSFQSFHIKKFFKKNSFLKNSNKTSELVKIAYAPYGGFFFSKDWVKKIGLPNLSYRLYSDDHEYTYRITRNNGSIYLCCDSEVVDIEKSWYLNDANVHRFFISNVDKNRLFMSIKNRVFFERKNIVTSPIVYFLNAFLFMIANFIKSSLNNVKAYKNLGIIIRAILAGCRDE